ncbi:MAG: sigma-70 family RNA polymerase sigma factor [Pseudomonadota bacterium]
MSHTGYETPALIATAIYQGDAQAETVLFERYYKSTLYILERKTGDHQLAQDLCQEAFCIMLERLRSQPLADPDKLAGFLHNIAVNLHIADVRKSGRRKTWPDQELIDRVTDKSHSQYQTLLRDKAAAAVRLLIDSMDNPRDRQLLHGFYIEEKDKDELCAELALSQRHFDKVLFRAKQRFKEFVLEKKA